MALQLAVAKRPDEIQETIAHLLNAMTGVFSTPQWGGRAYKVARPGGPADKGKILAFMAPDEAGTGVVVSFKIPPDVAEIACDKFEWIEPHSFRTLAPSGWVTASVTAKRQVYTLTRLLNQSYALHDLQPLDAPAPPPAEPDEAGHIDRVMGKARNDGWQPQSDW